MNTMNWPTVFPEIVLLTMACVVALVDLWVTCSQRKPTYWLTQLTLVVVGAMHLSAFNDGLTLHGMQGMVVADPLGHLLGFFACIATFVTLVYARPYAAERDMLKGELFTLSLFTLLGISVMLQAANFLVVYLGLEVMSLSLYALVALRRDHAVSTEAAMKYFVLGALASGFLLYGLSMMYGATGSLSIPEVLKVIGSGAPNKSVLVFGIVFIVAGLAFKLGAAPFHMWVPDVYQGAPTPVTLLIGAAPKLAAFAMMMRLLVEGMFHLAVDWQQMLLVLAVVSLVIGNLAAIAQSNLKRMLAYSTIGQMGFVVLALAVGVVHGNTGNGQNAYSAAMFYIITYVLTTLASFGIILLLAREGFESEEIADLAGLNQRSPLYAAIMSICLFSLAGVPPLVGFYAKFAVLEALIASGEGVHLGLAIFAVMMSLVAAFYYLRVVKVMYFDEPITATTVAAPADVRVVLTINGALILLLGIVPGGLMTLCADAILKTLGT